MHRLFGKSKAKDPTPTLDDASKSMEARGGAVDERVKKLDAELLRYKAQLSKMKAGPAKSQVQQRAMRCLQQKKVYERQRDQLYGQQLNIDQAKFAQDSVKDNIQLVKAMKETQKGLKKDMKQINIDQVEDLHDDMSDLLEDADEVNDIMGRAYGVPEAVDEEGLMDELEAMEGELEVESSAEAEEVPSYLVNAATAARSSGVARKEEAKAGASYPEVEVDEMGLPQVPVRSVQI